MRQYSERLYLFLAAAALLACVTTVMGVVSRPADIARADGTPTLTWQSPLNNSNPIGYAGERVMIIGSNFTADGSIVVELEQQSSCASTVQLSKSDHPSVVTNAGSVGPISFTTLSSANVGATVFACAYSISTGTQFVSALNLIASTKALNIVATAAPKLAVPQDDTKVAPGADVKLAGSHWDKDGPVTITLTSVAQATGGATTPTPISTATVNLQQIHSSDKEGTFQTSIIAPNKPDTYTVTASADGGELTATLTITVSSSGSAGSTSTGGHTGGDSSKFDFASIIPNLFYAIILLVLIMAGMFIWLATRRETGVGRQL